MSVESRDGEFSLISVPGLIMLPLAMFAVTSIPSFSAVSSRISIVPPVVMFLMETELLLSFGYT